MSASSNQVPGYPDGYQPEPGTFSGIVNEMVGKGFAKWGFVIIRGVYDNNTEWTKFISLLKASLADDLHECNMYDKLWPSLEWTIIEDRTALENAPKNVVRTYFRKWVSEGSIERDGPGVESPWIVRSVPRFKYCIYVDEMGFNSLTAWPPYQTLKRTPQWCLCGGPIILIDATYRRRDRDTGHLDGDEDDYEGEDYEAIEGNTEYDVGWMYTDVTEFAGLYDGFSHLDSDQEAWLSIYDRPEEFPEEQSLSLQRLSAVPEGVPYGACARLEDDV